jgi:hypothetical protein
LTPILTASSPKTRAIPEAYEPVAALGGEASAILGNSAQFQLKSPRGPIALLGVVEYIAQAISGG